MTDALDTEKLCRVYRKIREARAENNRQADARDAELKAQMHAIEMVLLKHLNDTKSDSVKTAEGTFYRQTDIMPSVADWDALYDWILADKDRFEALERRVKKTFVSEYIERTTERDDDGKITYKLPPGVSVTTQYVVRVRAPQ